MENNQIQTPGNIDDYIENGIQKGKRYKRVKRRTVISMMSSFALILIFVTSIKVSPAFANTVKTLPGMEAIVKMIEGDRGIEDAVQNDFIQEIDVSETHGDVTLTVDRIIVDQARMILFYSIHTTGDYSFLRLKRPDLLSGDGTELKVSLSYNDPNEGAQFKQEKKLAGKMDIQFRENVEVPEILVLETRLEEAESGTSTIGHELDHEWHLEIPIDKKWFENTRETIAMDPKIQMKNQTIHLEKLVIDPIRIGLHMKFDEKNTMQLFHFDDIKLVDEKGETWPLSNGLMRTGSEDDFVLYFQSNYFRKPKELYLTGSSIRAMDKEERNVVIDVKEEKLKKSPEDGRIRLKEVTKEGNNLQFHLSVQLDEQDKEKGYQMFSHTLVNDDAETQEAIATRDDELISEIYFTVYNPTNQNEIVLKLIDYPNRIIDPFKVKIK